MLHFFASMSARPQVRQFDPTSSTLLRWERRRQQNKWGQGLFLTSCFYPTRQKYKRQFKVSSTPAPAQLPIETLAAVLRTVLRFQGLAANIYDCLERCE